MIRDEAWLSVVTVFLNGNGRHTELDNPGVRGRLTLGCSENILLHGPFRASRPGLNPGSITYQLFDFRKVM